MIEPVPTVVYDTYWRFAAERHAMYERRLRHAAAPWTADPILRQYRFTNAYRASDRVSQYLIRDVQYRPDRSQAPRSLFLRTMLFKLFNKIETWEFLEESCGPILDTLDFSRLDALLTRRREQTAIYSAAYIMPSPKYGNTHKHTNHLALLLQMMDDRLPDRLRQAPSLQDVYHQLLGYPGIGKFLAFQYAIDLNYSSFLDFDEKSLVIAGPGAIDGISKCFSSTAGWSAEQIIMWVTERQDLEFKTRGITFPGLFGRPLQPIDCQNLFCEISKYSRVAHPDIAGSAGRSKIKQLYRSSHRPLPEPWFPPRWALNSNPLGFEDGCAP